MFLGNQNDNSNGSSFSTSDCSVLLINAAQANSAKVDFMHFFGSSNGPTLAAPSDVNDLGQFSSFNINSFSTKNNTLFVKLAAGFDFVNVTYTGIADAYAAASGTPINKAANLSQSDIWAFKTAAGKYGVLLVGAISGSNSSAGQINLTVKTQN